jgi:tetratricopeptide (TPR) repeat protein
LELPSWDDPDVSILELVSEWFQSTSDPFLLILDNADNIVHYWPGKYKDPNTSLDQPDTNLAKYLPDEDSNGKVLVTTRDSRVATRLMKHGKPIVLQPMAMDEARELFLSQVENDELVVDEESIKALMRALDFLPLAISQAASFIEENALPISEYLQALHNDEAEEFLNEELNDSRRDEESINSVFRTWKISFDQIKRQKPRAAELLSLLACLDRQSIPKWLLKDMPELVTSISLLQAFAMVTARAGSHTYQLHRLVQKFVQLSLKRAGTLAKWEATALNCVSKIYPTEIGVEEWSICDSLAPHVQIVTKYTHTTKEARLDLAHLLCWAADFDIERGMYVQALNRARQSLELFRELVPFNDDRLAAATWLYGRLVYYEAKSEADLEQAAGILRESLEISSHATLNYAEAAFELAHIYYAQGKEIECLEMGKASFECWMAMEGERSVRTLDNRHDYALELAMFGDENEAIKNWQIILDLTPTSDASENTKSVYTYRSLASIAEFQGDAQLAEMLYTKLIKLCSTIYNPEHIHVFDYRLSHAEQILRQGRADEAMQLSMDMLEACKNKSEWRIALSCYEMMAECCKLNNDLDGEQANRLKCCELHTRFLGATHKDTIATVDAAAQVLSRNGKHDQAEAMHQHVLAWREVTLGADHAGTLFSEEHVAICKTNRGYDHEAESIFSKLYDKEHVDGARVLDNLCSTLWNQQKWDELELRCRRALTVDSDYRLGAHWMLVTSLEKQGKMAEALALRAESLEIEDVSHDPTEMRRQVVQPVVEAPLDRRFGRIIHPRTWSA